MIVFELCCAKAHRFEAWFKDGAAFELQAEAGEIACPECGDSQIVKAPMAPRLNSARGDALEVKGAARAMRGLLGELRRAVEANCDYVGERFSEEARKIHYGETEPRAIYGEATPEQAGDLADEGIAITSIPWIRRDD